MAYNLLARPQVGLAALVTEGDLATQDPRGRLGAVGARPASCWDTWCECGRRLLWLLSLLSLLNIFHVFKHFGWRDIAVLARLRSVVFPWLPQVGQCLRDMEAVQPLGSAANCLMLWNML